MTHQRNIEGLKNAARRKAEMTRQQVEETLRQMTQGKKQQPINFKTVAEAAGVSTAWLYAQQDIRERITHLRRQQVPHAQVEIPKSERASDESKDRLIAVLRQQVKELRAQNADLRKQLETAYGLVHAQM